MIAATMTKGNLSSLVEAARGRIDTMPAAGGQRAFPTPRWLVARRLAAIGRFLKTGVPTIHDEAWKFTDLTRLASVPYVPSGAAADVSEAAMRVALPRIEGPTLVFASGLQATPRLSLRLPEGVQLTTVAERLRGDDGTIDRLWQATAALSNPFADLNEATAADGGVLQIAPKTVVAEPIHIVHLALADPLSPRSGHPRHFVEIGKGAQATIVESYATLGEGSHFTNPVTFLNMGAGAHVEHLKLNVEAKGTNHVAVLDASLARDARLTSHSFVFGGDLVRNDIDVRFTGPGAEVTLNGLYVENGKQHVDHHTFVDHAVPHCTSNEFYKGILDDASRGVFFGKVLIRKDAQKSNAAQSNKNLILSDGALADSTPALEIFADDVKAAHGSTTGQLDKDHLFYLRARGLDAGTARGILTYAFARDIVARVHDLGLRAMLDELLFTRLPNGGHVREVLHEVQA